MNKPAPADPPIHDLLRDRWSARAFDPDRPVDRGDLRALLEAIRWAPSSFNEQPWRFLVFDGGDDDARGRARECLAVGNSWARQAPVLLLSVAKETFTRNDRPNRHAQHDVGLATENLMLEASSRGLAVHAMAGFDAARAREEFGIPDGFTLMAMIAIGHPGAAEDLPEPLRERERAPRARRAVSSWAYSGAWERPFGEE